MKSDFYRIESIWELTVLDEIYWNLILKDYFLIFSIIEYSDISKRNATNFALDYDFETAY